MALYKLITIIGIHSKEEFIENSPEDKWKAALRNPDFVAAALFQGGQVAPLSGQQFYFLKAKAR